MPAPWGPLECSPCLTRLCGPSSWSLCGRAVLQLLQLLDKSNFVKSGLTHKRELTTMRRTVATMLKQSHRVDVDQASKTIRFIPDQAKHTATMLVLHGLGDTAMGWGASL